MFDITFPVSGVTTSLFIPPAVAFVLAYFGAMAGVTGAFLLLPFQISILGYTAPGVSATNFLYNIYAIPMTVLRYTKEGRMNWPLAFLISGGSLPGISAGYYIRVSLLHDPSRFKCFAGLVLLYLAWRLLKSLLEKWIAKTDSPSVPHESKVTYEKVSLHRFSFRLGNDAYSFNPILLFSVALLVGLVGGAYGIGGGAILAPFCITVLGLPVHGVAGASLFGTFISSVIGVGVYSLGLGAHGMETRPDILLGTLFGVGGLLGGYLGAMSQRYIPERPIKAGLFLVVVVAATKYLWPWIAAIGRQIVF